MRCCQRHRTHVGSLGIFSHALIQSTVSTNDTLWPLHRVQSDKTSTCITSIVSHRKLPAYLAPLVHIIQILIMLDLINDKSQEIVLAIAVLHVAGGRSNATKSTLYVGDVTRLGSHASTHQPKWTHQIQTLPNSANHMEKSQRRERRHPTPLLYLLLPKSLRMTCPLLQHISKPSKPSSNV